MQRSYCALSHLFLIATAVVVLSLWDSVVYLYHDESLVNKSLNILVLFLFSFQLLGQFFRAVCSGWQGFCLPPTPLPSWVDRGWPAPSLHSLWSAHWPVCLSHTHTKRTKFTSFMTRIMDACTTWEVACWTFCFTKRKYCAFLVYSDAISFISCTICDGSKLKQWQKGRFSS